MKSPGHHAPSVRHRRYPPASAASSHHAEAIIPSGHPHENISALDKVRLPFARDESSHREWLANMEERLLAVERAHTDLAAQLKNLR